MLLGLMNLDINRQSFGMQLGLTLPRDRVSHLETQTYFYMKKVVVAKGQQTAKQVIKKFETYEMHFALQTLKLFNNAENDENSAGCIFKETFFHGNAAIFIRLKKDQNPDILFYLLMFLPSSEQQRKLSFITCYHHLISF